MDLIHWNARISLYICLFIASSNAMHFFSLEHIAWQQEEAPCGGPFMSEAIIFEWTSAPAQQSTNICLLRERCIKDWNTVQYMAVCQRCSYNPAYSLLFVLICWRPAQFVCLTPVSSLSLLLYPFVFFLHLPHCATNQLASQLCLSHPFLFLSSPSALTHKRQSISASF